MNVQWNDIFQLPDAALADNKRIPKTVLVQQAALTKHEQKTLDKVKRVGHFATVQKSTTKILPFIDDEYDIQSIVFLHCEMAGSSQAVTEVAYLLHKCFPNPTVIMQELGEQISLSIAIKRKSLAEKGAVVVARTESVRPFNTEDAAYEDYLVDIDYANLPQQNLLAYLTALCDRTFKASAIGAIGAYPRCSDADTPKLMALLSQLKELRSSINDLEQQYRDKDTTIAESSKLRMELVCKKQEQTDLSDRIKELCNG